MRNLITLIFLIFATNSFAISHYVEKANVEDCSLNQLVYSGPMAGSICSQKGECYEVTELPYNCSYAKVIDEEIDDPSKPVYSKNDVESCLDEEDCQTKLEAKTCTDSEESKIKNLDSLEVYCTKFLRYEQMLSGRKVVVIDEVKKATFDAEQATKQAQENAVKMALQAMEKGKEIIANVAVRNVSKGLTTAQVSAFLIEFADVKAMLETGSLQTAKEAVTALTISENITQEDKDFVIGLINSALGI